ncbi:MAG: ABC transporter ATP-binding protein [Opitutales bacterium]
MGKDCVIRIRGLEKSFEDNKVLRGVDFEVAPGRITTIIGKSGEGKSVLLKCVSGLMQADAGSVEINCGRLEECGSPRLSYMFQQNALFDSMTAFENVALPLQERTRFKSSEIRRKVEGLFQKLDLVDIGHLYPSELSGGMQKRVALARALVLDPEVVLFDEPTTGLDPLRKNAVFTMIERYQSIFGYTAVVVSHDLPECLYISESVALLDGGRIQFEGSPLELEQQASAMTEGFLHSRDKLRDELSGLRHTRRLEQRMRRARPEEGFGAFLIDPFAELEEQLGEFAGHLIESNLARALGRSRFFHQPGYSLARGEMVFGEADPVEDPEADLREQVERFEGFMRDLKSTRCVDFSISYLRFRGSEMNNLPDLRRKLRQEGTLLFQFSCT